MAKITYDDKSTLNPQPSIANENKVTSGDMNEIKTVVNGLDDEIGTLSNLNTTVKTDVVSAVNEVKTTIGGVLLWTNANPTQAFNNATINLSSSDYDVLEIFYKHNVNDSYLLSQKTLKGQGTILMTHSGTGDLFRKIFTATSTTLTTTDSTETFIVPIYVVGYKLGIFS